MVASRSIVCIVLFWVFGIDSFDPVLLLADEPKKQTAVAEVNPASSKVFVELAKQVRPSIVTVAHLGRDGKQLGLGTGFVIDSKGLIATNLHVIGEARMIRVIFQDGSTAAVKSVHAIDRDADLAILQIDTVAIKGSLLKQISLGDTVEQGEVVAAIGHPNGLKNTLVTGVVSGTQEINGRELIQVSMPIDFGNSGGPLLSQQGEVLGIITYKSASTESVGFAMPVADLKRLLKNPHPVSMDRWMTIGALDPKLWQTFDGAMWRQRAGQIHVTGLGKGFGGRVLCLWQDQPEKLDEFEVAVSVRLEDESGAAGLVFQSDGQDRHYGFYPSNGGLRISRFDGADVFSWQVLKQVTTAHYHPGEWNYLKVSVQGTHIKCFCNDKLIFDLNDGGYTQGKMGLAKFRNTTAVFRDFQLAQHIADYHLDDELTARLKTLLEQNQGVELLSAKTVEELSQFPENSRVNLEEAARELEHRADQLRQLSLLSHQHRVSQKLVEELKKKNPSLSNLALLLARFDNAEVDVDSYQKVISRLVEDLQTSIPEELKDPKQRRVEFDRLLFQEYGFHGSTTNYYNKSNSYLNEVIDDREGLPILLSVLYISLAQELGLDIRGVGLPGHFVVQQYIDKKPGDVIDVFNKGRILSLDEIITQTEIRSGRPWTEDYLAPQLAADIYLRMVRNLKGIVEEKENYEDILRYTNLLVLTDPEHEVENRYLRALLNIRTKRAVIAYEDLDWLSENAADVIEASRIAELRSFADRWLRDNAPQVD